MSREGYRLRSLINPASSRNKRQSTTLTSRFLTRRDLSRTILLQLQRMLSTMHSSSHFRKHNLRPMLGQRRTLTHALRLPSSTVVTISLPLAMLRATPKSIPARRMHTVPNAARPLHVKTTWSSIAALTRADVVQQRVVIGTPKRLSTEASDKEIRLLSHRHQHQHRQWHRHL